MRGGYKTHYQDVPELREWGIKNGTFEICSNQNVCRLFTVDVAAMGVAAQFFSVFCPLFGSVVRYYRYNNGVGT